MDAVVDFEMSAETRALVEAFIKAHGECSDEEIKRFLAKRKAELDAAKALAASSNSAAEAKGS